VLRQRDIAIIERVIVPNKTPQLGPLSSLMASRMPKLFQLKRRIFILAGRRLGAMTKRANELKEHWMVVW
jgi:hypothetical protein